MTETIHFDREPVSNQLRDQLTREEPIGQRTFTPTLAVLAKSAGIYHWTPEGRRLADFTSGVLVANLGHHPRPWLERFAHYLQWNGTSDDDEYAAMPPWTAYNAISTLEIEANRRLLASLRAAPGGGRMERVLWAASGSEGIQKALWACLKFQPQKDIILATRHGFHGKKGLAGAVTGDETAPDRDPRVRFITFPREECYDLDKREAPFNAAYYLAELQRLQHELPNRLNCLITEPYLGGGGSFHPPRAYLQLLQQFCHENGLVFILDEVQSNFGRTGTMYAFESYGIEPDIVVLGKGMGNGVPANAAVGRAEVFASLGYGEGSDTWSGHPIGCAALLATLDIFETTDVLAHTAKVSRRLEQGLRRLKELPIVAAVRGEGMVWGVELANLGSVASADLARECVRAAYLGDAKGNAIHLLGPLAGNVIRVSPPLVITEAEADFWCEVLFRIFEQVAHTISSDGMSEAVG